MLAMTSPIYQTEQIREFERLAMERYSLTDEAFMQKAGKAALDFMLRRWGQAETMVVFCGGGHNGGDGYVLATLAKERGLKVKVYHVGELAKMKPLTKRMHDAAKHAGVSILAFEEKLEIHADLIVDALCGIGVNTALRDEMVQAIRCMQRSQAPIFSLDIPSGIDADTGNVLGVAVHANATLTFIGYKLGLLTGSGAAHTGELAMHDLQLPAELHTYVSPIAEKDHFSLFSHYLKPRARDWHKGLSGHVLIVGGGEGYSGAARLAAESALRVGAGRVTLAVWPGNADLMNVHYPELMCHGVETPDALKPLLALADVVVLGPGLTQTDWGQALWQAVIETELPLVLDADGLNLLVGKSLNKENWVMTPHPGEAARLLGVSVPDVQSDRLSSTKALANQFGGVCVLKGAGTVVVAPNALPMVCDKGNPGMATAGMGDVLSGVIGGLMAQSIPLNEAAKLGVLVHAMAGDLAAKEGERGMIASDLLPYLRRLMNHSSGPA
jgi:hydroxyethylthiazole kinase-like uncharacterized protein yjeF